jgi:hypothetical protein
MSPIDLKAKLSKTIDEAEKELGWKLMSARRTLYVVLRGIY